MVFSRLFIRTCITNHIMTQCIIHEQFYIDNVALVSGFQSINQLEFAVCGRQIVCLYIECLLWSRRVFISNAIVRYFSIYSFWYVIGAVITRKWYDIIAIHYDNESSQPIDIWARIRPLKSTPNDKIVTSCFASQISQFFNVNTDRFCENVWMAQFARWTSCAISE